MNDGSGVEVLEDGDLHVTDHAEVEDSPVSPYTKTLHSPLHISSTT